LIINALNTQHDLIIVLGHHVNQEMDIEFEEFDVVKLDEVLGHFYMDIRTGL
jgi:hypothetical protein